MVDLSSSSYLMLWSHKVARPATHTLRPILLSFVWAVHKHASIGPAPGRCCILNRPDAGKTFWPDIGPASFAQRRDIGQMPALRYMP